MNVSRDMDLNVLEKKIGKCGQRKGLRRIRKGVGIN